MTDSARISPTAHYTGWVWYRNGLSDRAFATGTGRVFFYALEPLNRLSSLVTGGLSLERTLLQRHLIIDHLLDRAVEAGATQVLEVACGLSARGWRTVQRHTGLRYVEADLPQMAAQKRRLLETLETDRGRHVVVDLDVLADAGESSLAAVAGRELDAETPTVIITEGLVDYFAPPVVRAMWGRFAELLAGLSGGVYLSDLHLRSELPRTVFTRAFAWGLERFTGGALADGFTSLAEAQSALEAAGFDAVELHSPTAFYDALDLPRQRRAPVIRVIEASVGEAR